MLDILSQGFGIFAIALLGGAAGATTKHFLTFFGKRAEQKVRSWDALTQLISESLGEVRELSVIYWSQNEKKTLKPKAARIVALCENIPDLYLQLFEKNPDIKRQLDVQMNRLSNVVTGGSFQQSDRKADQNVIAEMEVQLMALDVAIRLNSARLNYPWR